MSNLLNDTKSASAQGSACPVIEHILTPRTADLGSFSVRRLLPTAKRKMVGPWIFFDEMGPAQFPPGEGVNVKPHPHIGLATVTYLFAGEMLHRDSLGSVQAVLPGDINLMVAGKGIVHSEREADEVRNKVHEQHGLQLWLALPADQEEMAPAFHHIDAEDIPRVVIDQVPVRVLMGNAYGVSSPVPVFSPTLYLEAELQSGQSLTLPAAAERGLYIVSGELLVDGTQLSEHHMALLTEQAEVKVQAQAPTRIALIGGDPLGKRFIDWNFVASRKELIEQAKADWQAGRFAKVPGDEKDYIAYP
ncbi:MAG: pirin family protein [Pseudomonadaceae bacterium]|nr:MAG: pirin family protein [Pseudomonadaceae bacterium]